MSIDREEPRDVAGPAPGRDAAAAPAPRPTTALPPGSLEALRRRDPAVLPLLLEAHGRELAGVAFLILRDAAEAEDVVVDTLLTALERGSELRHDGALRSWLLRIATNRALAHLRRRRRIVALEVVDAGAVDAGARGPAAIRAMVLNAVHRLPPRMRAAIVLR